MQINKLTKYWYFCTGSGGSTLSSDNDGQNAADIMNELNSIESSFWRKRE